MERRVVPGGEELIGKSGKVVVMSPMDGVVVLRMSGNVTKEVVPPLVALLDKMLSAHPVPTTYFYDLWEMSAYESALRVDLTNWHLDHRDKLKALHAIARARLVRMGITVANLALRKIVHHDDRSTFEAALRNLERAQPTA